MGTLPGIAEAVASKKKGACMSLSVSDPGSRSHGFGSKFVRCSA